MFTLLKKYTLVAISDFMATSHRREIVISRQHEGRFIYKMKGKRKENFVPDTKDMLVFEGHDLPFLLDTERTYENSTNGVISFTGNACFNFVTDTPTDLKLFIDTKNINKDFHDFGRILHEPIIVRKAGEEQKPLFPDEAETCGSIIVRKMIGRG